MKPQYTPGPWIIERDIAGPEILDFSGSYRIARICTSGFGESRTDKCNATLIVAAPEMLEMLEEVARLPVAREYPDGPCIEKYMMDDILAIIKKAKGES